MVDLFFKQILQFPYESHISYKPLTAPIPIVLPFGIV